MLFLDILKKKRDAESLTSEEIKFAVASYTQGRIPDFQMSAFLMAVCLNGLTAEETRFLTAAMLASGETIDLSSIPGTKVDKHSTGGVGDGTSLVVAPLVASCGVVVPMMAGRALGHTGGTLDKLESIPGFSVALTKERFINQLKEIGVAITGQTERIAPADKKMYALRDVTATVDSIPLIASSIMSKKLAEGSDCLLLDVKTGSGAFMRERSTAKALAQEMIRLARSFGKRASAVITDMNQPLGNAVGNSLEVQQAIDVMKGKGPRDYVGLIIELASGMLALVGSRRTKTDRVLLEKKLRNGEVLEKFKVMIQHQDGDPSVVDVPEKILPRARHTREITTRLSGYVSYVNTMLVGEAANLLGAVRRVPEDRIDHAAGIILAKKNGDAVEKGETIATFHFNDESRFPEAKLKFLESVRFITEKPRPRPLVYEKVGNT